MAADIANLGQLEEDGEHGDEERRLARFLIGGSMLRRRVCDASFSHACSAAEPERKEKTRMTTRRMALMNTV